MLKDLEFVKKHFELMNLKQVVTQVEKEISTLRENQPLEKNQGLMIDRHCLQHYLSQTSLLLNGVNFLYLFSSIYLLPE